MVGWMPRVYLIQWLSARMQGGLKYMRRKGISIGVVMLLILAVASAYADGTCSAVTSKSPQLTVTGVVTARDGSQLSIRSDDGKIYRVDADNSTVTLDRLPANCMSLRVGDRVRVFGAVVSGNRICASRLHIFMSQSEASAIVMPPAIGSGPSRAKPARPKHERGGEEVRIPAVGDSLGSWRNRGLVLGVTYGDRTMTIATSTGPFVIDASAATVVAFHGSVSLARITQGDAVRIWGELVGLHKIRADRIELMRDKDAQESAVPVKNAAISGKIDYIDYPSFTFRVNTGTGETRVLVDENTFIHLQGDRKAFMDLSVGQVVKVDGFGNLTSGFVASLVQVVGDPGS
jgi:hypothetical protein